ncbi:MAG TPA: cohesin domain-containing protein [Terriglobales bacterium]|nr:cohesin domain-containing protein [Terriglobales bacterium]
MSRFTRAATLFLALFLLFSAAALADQAKKLYDQGKAAEARENYEAAYDLYSKAFDLKPVDIRYKAAVTRLRFLAAASYVHRGQKLRDDGKLEDALVLFEKAYMIDPSSFIAQQEIRKTKAMIDAKSGGGGARPEAMSPIRKRLESAQEPVELAPISNVPITLKLTEDSKVIYQTIGKLAGLNVLFDPDYTSRRISVELNGVTLDQALQVVAMESKTFWRPVTPNTIFVASDTIAKRKELEQNVIKTFYLSNVSLPTELQDMVNAIRSILEVSRIQQLPTQKAIVVRGTPDQVALAEKLISDIDKAKPEVIIDVVVMQVTHDLIRDLGISPPGSASVALQGTTSTTTTTTTGTTTGTATGTTVPNTLTLNQFANLTANNFLVTIPPATANFVFSNANTKIIQSPRIRASDGQKASLKIGDRVPVATGSFQPGIGGVGINPLVNTQFQYIDVGVNVDITPQVHANREVSMKVTIDVSAVISQVSIGGIQQPVIGQRKIEHEIRLKEGEVNLLGGIFEDQAVKNLSGIPGLGQIPILKYLFATEHTEKHQNEIVFALIPHIVRAQELSAMNERALDVGTGTSIELRRKIESPGGGAPQGTVFQPRTSEPRPVSAAPAQNPPAATPAMPPAQPSQQAQLQAPQTPLATPPTTPSGPIAFTFDPPTISQATGSTFPVNVMLTGGQDVFSVPLQISYDAKLLQLVNVSNGSFLSQDGQPVALVHRDDPATGMLQVTATRPPASGGASGQGTVLTLTFLARAPGQGTVAITRPGARNSSGQVIPASGGQASVTVH